MAADDIKFVAYVGQILRGSMIPGWMSADLAAMLYDLDPRIAQESIVSPEITLRALNWFPPHKTRVVILGQDPYPQPGKATGLCFGVDNTWATSTNYIPDSSIANIQQELADDTTETLNNLSLEHWASQGVLMLNTRLSVAANKPMSHADLGWEPITSYLLHKATHEQPTVVVAWGAEARRFAERSVQDKKNTVIITSAHPCRRSASRGFFGSKPFSMVNTILKEMGHAAITWGG